MDQYTIPNYANKDIKMYKDTLDEVTSLRTSISKLPFAMKQDVKGQGQSILTDTVNSISDLFVQLKHDIKEFRTIKPYQISENSSSVKNPTFYITISLQKVMIIYLEFTRADNNKSITNSDLVYMNIISTSEIKSDDRHLIPSKFTIFRGITKLCKFIWNDFVEKKVPNCLFAFLVYMTKYENVFNTPCSVCKQLLMIGGEDNMVLPYVRYIDNDLAYHPRCYRMNKIPADILTVDKTTL
ncbi:hypothetical protein WA158_004998 [Blastocystis sp. Blastoise]